MSDWYLFYNGQNVGPMTKENLMAYNPTKETLIWKEGWSQWRPLYTEPELLAMLEVHNQPQFPPPPPQYQQKYNKPIEQKDKTTAALLAMFLGQFGIQYFYLGKTNAGLISLAICFIEYVLFIWVFFFWVWPLLTFIQGIMMLTMSQEEFERKYIYTDNTFPLF